MPIDYDSFGLNDELKEKLKLEIEEEFTAIRAKNTEIIGREKAAKLLADETALNAAKAEEEAKIALAEKSGDIEKYKLAVSESKEKIESMQLEFTQKENARVVDMAVNEFVSANVSSDPAAKAYMESIFRKNIDVVDGAIKPKDVTKSLEDLQKGLVSDEAYSKYIKVDVGSGSGSQGSTGVNGTAKSLSEMNATEQAAYANAHPEKYALAINQGA